MLTDGDETMLTFKTIALSAIIGIGALGGVATTTATAEAGGNVQFHANSNGAFGIYIGPGGGGYYNGPRRHHRYERPHRRHYDRGFCKPRKAVRKARRMGLRRAHIKRVNNRKVVVVGRMDGYRERMVFANVRGCPRVR